MIPKDSYTLAVIALLTFLGLLGLILPAWFIRISRFPFIFQDYPPVDESRRRWARLWGVLSLLGATFLAFAIS